MTTMTIDTLRRILIECAGGDESAPELAGDISAVDFEELGYDSLALIESASRIRRDFGVVIPDDDLVEVRTPQELVDIVNERLRGAA
ncbi:acyl carrier protein [Nocardia pseudobrasiliensis]|uniref:Act minimal PKS acyl carrier protein n=1 Tax=Nocardia pseudobrasiliensis TaxID=45979 RepID=A0A370HXT4_9NOCA|nr:phosphopantetheine-binding protein [Nocardia pseudobrasiliensis]RDI62721.1 act minimal PKS acyl carrier protein [Nocardia pseudobrasiliensis]